MRQPQTRLTRHFQSPKFDGACRLHLRNKTTQFAVSEAMITPEG
jgi:hypothetical protein